MNNKVIEREKEREKEMVGVNLLFDAGQQSRVKTLTLKWGNS